MKSWYTLLRTARYEAQKRYLSLQMAQYLLKTDAYTELLQAVEADYALYSPDSFTPDELRKMTPAEGNDQFDGIPIGVLNRDIPFDAVLVISDLPPREVRIRKDGTMIYYEFGEASPF